jgi:hypothetical protein
MRKTLTTLIAAGLMTAGLGLSLPAAADVKFELNLLQPARHQAADAVGARVNRYVRGGVLPVRQLAGIGPYYNGREIQAVEVSLRPHHPGTRVALLGDGRVYDAERVGRDGRVVLHPGRGGVLGRDMHRVGLQVRGGAFVHSIRVVFEPARHRGPYWRRHDDRRDHRDWNRHDDRRDHRDWNRHDDRRERRTDNRNRNAG